MLFTSVPVQAFSAEEPAPRIPVSAPFEHPESVVYEAKQQEASQASSSSQSASAETTESISIPSSSSNAQTSGDSSTSPESANASESASEIEAAEDVSSPVETPAEGTSEEPPLTQCRKC